MTNINRRQFNKLMGKTVVAVPLAGIVATLPSHAADLPAVDLESATAKALQYMVASDKEGLVCSGCALYSGEEGSESGPCAAFPGASVAAAGWCTAYAAKPA